MARDLNTKSSQSRPAILADANTKSKKEADCRSRVSFVPLALGLYACVIVRRIKIGDHTRGIKLNLDDTLRMQHNEAIEPLVHRQREDLGRQTIRKEGRVSAPATIDRNQDFIRSLSPRRCQPVDRCR